MRDYMVVISMIPFGRENAIPRAELANLARMTDRQVRKCIEAARSDGHYIVASPEGGYYQTQDINEIEYQYRIDRARALAVLKRLKPMRRELKEAGRKV